MIFRKKLMLVIFASSFLSACNAVNVITQNNKGDSSTKQSNSDNNGVNPNYDEGSDKKAVIISQTDKGAMITSDERILFDSGKYSIKDSGQIFLERVAKILKDKSTADVIIKGHTDNVGGMKMNQKLSEQRAQAVKDGLVGHGIEISRIETQGFGFSMPVADNGTKAGRQENRRTEIIIVGETVEEIGGHSLADQLSAGLDMFLENASQFISDVFGSDDSK